jgi:hypothetical protein
MNHRIHMFVVYVDYFFRIPLPVGENEFGHKVQLPQFPGLASKTTSGPKSIQFFKGR